MLITIAAVAVGTVVATSAFAQVGNIRFHYVTAGTGEPVLLLPGWPESWIAWRKVLPLLVNAGRRVIILDPRGFGESDKPAGGYDLDTAARDLHGFLQATNLAAAGGIDVVAHDRRVLDRTRARRQLSSGRKTTGADRVKHTRGHRVCGRTPKRGRKLEELAICFQSAERSAGDTDPGA
jgi:hypothetical protein